MTIEVGGRTEVHTNVGVTALGPGGVTHQQVDLTGLNCGETLGCGQRNEVDSLGVAQDGGGNCTAVVSVEADLAAVRLGNRERNGGAGDTTVELTTVLDASQRGALGQGDLFFVCHGFFFVSHSFFFIVHGLLFVVHGFFFVCHGFFVVVARYGIGDVTGRISGSVGGVVDDVIGTAGGGDERDCEDKRKQLRELARVLHVPSNSDLFRPAPETGDSKCFADCSARCGR